MGIVHAWRGAKLVAVTGVLVMCAGCVINARSASPTSVSPPSPPTAPAATRSSPVSPPVSSPHSATSTPARLTGPGTYAFSYQGAVGTIQVPANIMDPRLERYGDYRRLAKARPITYLIAQVDNRSDDTITMYEVVVVTNDGQQIEATSVSDYVDIWRDAFATEDGDVAKYNQGIELSNSSNFYLHPGAKGTAILGAKEPIKTVKRVFVYPAGAFDRVEARRTS
ncbi:hypothetical protein EV647_6411 [Kribbella sp. VKM Ac-2566]|nr:hypothetical protein EV647_6411 [Kribbella sp. VKM Ac-2566]